MSTATYPLQSMSSSNHCPSSSYMSSSIASGGIVQQTNRNIVNSNNSGSAMVMQTPSPPLPISRGEGTYTSTMMTCDCEMEPKSQLQNSSTMDSGVEDCCEPTSGTGGPSSVVQNQPPPPPVPSIDMDDKAGQRLTVNMLKQDGIGYGFSVVWVTPPRIERLEKGKTADVAGLRIGDLIIGVNGEDVTTAPNTTIYTKMKTTGNELELEVWRKYPQVQPRTPANNPLTTPKSSSILHSTNENNTSLTNSNEGYQNQNRETQQSPCAACLPQNNKNSSTNTTTITHIPAPLMNRIQCQPPPISILKPPPPAPPTAVVNPHSPHIHSSQQQPAPSSGSSSWRIRFNIEVGQGTYV